MSARLFWSDHALERLEERARASFVRAVRDALRARDWDVWYEVDPREGRGLRRNLVVPRQGEYRAVVRVNEDGNYIVVSVLTAQQAHFNTSALWHKTAEAARANRPRPTAGPLTHNPFATLGRKRR